MSAAYLLPLLLCSFWALCHASDRLVEREVHLLGRSAEEVIQELKGIPPGEFAQKVEDKKQVPVVNPPTHIAGYFKLSGTTDSHMFYFFFKSRKHHKSSPLVLWTNGGPGCSSSTGVFFEQGPYKIEDDLTLSLRDNSWDITNNMIFVDQPVGTGFSYTAAPGDHRHVSRAGVALDVVEFLHEFYAAHPDMAKRDLYVTGESYAGHYVPGILHGIIDSNEAGKDPKIPLVGAAIGNGLINPLIQYKAYSDFALMNKLIDKNQYNKMQSNFAMCSGAIKLCQQHGLMCGLALIICEKSQFSPILSANDKLNYYDIRIPCVGHLCYTKFDIMKKYLNLPSVQKELGVSVTWEECKKSVYVDMLNDWMLNYQDDVTLALEKGVRVLIYAGEKDLICNWVGNRNWVDSLEWHGASDWTSQSDFEWSVGGEAAGVVRETKTKDLVFVKVYNAGHMVPMDQPKNAYNMINKFIAGKSFKAQPTINTSTGADKVVWMQ